MDKTDMMFGPRDYLRRAARYAPSKESDKREHAARMNKEFGALDKPRDHKWSSRGAGMVHTPAPTNSRRCTWKRDMLAPLDTQDMAPVTFVSTGKVRKGSPARTVAAPKSFR